MRIYDDDPKSTCQVTENALTNITLLLAVFSLWLGPGKQLLRGHSVLSVTVAS